MRGGSEVYDAETWHCRIQSPPLWASMEGESDVMDTSSLSMLGAVVVGEGVQGWTMVGILLIVPDRLRSVLAYLDLA